MSSKKILFITKNYPPQLGGMENYCRDLAKYFGVSGNTVYLIANGKWRLWLPFFAVKAFFLWMYYAWKADAIWIGDGSISLIGLILGCITRTKRYVTIHALDITWNKRLYQKIIPNIVAKANHIVAVSQYAKDECIKRWVPTSKITVIPNGIDPDIMPEPSLTKDEIFARYGIDTSWKRVLLSLGRHIERKGIHWFLDEVIPKLGGEYVYVIGWWWPYTERYEQIIQEKNLKNVHLIGRPTNEEKCALYKWSDLFIMPNILVLWDAEWFGIVCIEAWWYGLPVIASNIEGIRDAVIDGETGRLMDKDVKDWVKAIFSPDILNKWVIHENANNCFNRVILIELYNSLFV